MSEIGNARTLNRFWFGQVDYPEKGRVLSSVRYLDEGYEIETGLAVRAFDYRVEEATYRIVRTPGGKRGAGGGTLSALAGAIAYAGVGARIEEAVGAEETGLIKPLLLENVKVLRQARLFVWDREGIDPASQLSFIERLLKDTCLHFAQPGSMDSVLHPVQLETMARGECLFIRHRYSLMRSAGGVDRVTSGICDSYHEMQVELTAEGDEVTEFEGRILRAPHEVCFKARETAQILREAKVSDGPNAWGKALLGPRGCTHLSDAAREACASLLYFRGKG